MAQTKGLTARLPLKVLTPAALVLPVVLVVLLIGGVAYVQGRAAATSLEMRGVEQVHGRIGDRLGALLDGPPRWNRLVREAIDTGELDPDNLASWREPIYRQRHAFDPALGGVAWGDPRGHAVWVFRYPGKVPWELGLLNGSTGGLLIERPLNPDGSLSDDWVRETQYDPRARPWYQLGVAAGEGGAWGEPYAWQSGEGGGGALTLGLPFSSAVLDERGELRGVLDTELSLEDLSAFLRTLKIAQTGVAVITDRDGRLIAASNDARLATDQLDRLAALGSEEPDVRALAAALAQEFPGGPKSFPGQWTGTVELEQGSALMTVSGFKRDGGLNWIVMTAVPTAAFTAEVEAIRARALRIALIAVGVTLLLGMLLSAWLVRPMLRVAAHARNVGAGDLETPLQLNQARELVELSGEFNNMTAGLRERLAMRRSLAHASEVQKALLPAADPVLPGFEVVGHCNYCDETGGDYYDYLGDAETAEDGAAVVIGDVMGHGIASAMLMATARGVLRSRSREGVGIADLLTHLNALLHEASGGMKFMTMLIVNLNPAFREMRWASAGHDAPIIYHPHTDEFREPEGGGLPLGVIEDEVYEDAAVEKLPPGAVVLVATDGMWETRNVAGEMHGKQRLQDSVRRHASKPAAEIRDGLLDDLHAFRGEGPQEDDETFVVIKVLGD
ncbi:MAG: SpoIIE family protein phosphatase [Planctomycetota bacterium]